MTRVLCDASVVVKWFHDEPGEETPAARTLAEAHEDGLVELRVLDLTYFEAGNTFSRLGASGVVVAHLLDQLDAICGPGLALDRQRRTEVAQVAESTRLTFYDAAYVTVAHQQAMALATSDRAMLRAGGVLPSHLLATLEGRA